MSDRYAHILSFALEHPWSVTRPMLATIASIMATRLAGLKASDDEIQAALVNRKNLPQPKVGSVGIIPVYGVISPRMNMLSEMSGGTTYDKLTGQLRDAVNSKDIKTIVLDVDSPGGSVAGNAEFAQEIMRARTKKPVIAVAQYLMGSAAYHLSAAATHIYAAPSARVGSIGTYCIHDDLSEAMARLGVKRTLISAGEGKTDGDPSRPLSEEAQARLQKAADDAYDQFVANVVKGRGAGMSADRVRKEWKAHVYGAADAKSIGMIDDIKTLDQTLTELLTASSDVADQRAARELTESATAQEPIAATAQERIPDYQFKNQTHRALLELTL